MHCIVNVKTELNKSWNQNSQRNLHHSARHVITTRLIKISTRYFVLLPFAMYYNNLLFVVLTITLVSAIPASNN